MTVQNLGVKLLPDDVCEFLHIRFLVSDDPKCSFFNVDSEQVLPMIANVYFFKRSCIHPYAMHPRMFSLFNNERRHKLYQPQLHKNMNWFHDLDQKIRDDVVAFLSQSIEHYTTFNKNVIIDIKKEFQITTSQVENLYEFIYLKEHEIETQDDKEEDDSGKIKC